MKRLILFLLVIVNVVLTTAAQSADYKIILESDTTVKTRAGVYFCHCIPHLSRMIGTK